MKLLSKEIKDSSTEPEVVGRPADIKIVTKQRPIWFVPSVALAGLFALFLLGKLTGPLGPGAVATDSAKKVPLAGEAQPGAAPADASVQSTGTPATPGFAGQQSAAADAKAKSPDTYKLTDESSYGGGPSKAPRPNATQIPPIAHQFIKTGSLELQVGDLRSALTEVDKAIQGCGGYEENRTQRQVQDEMVATMHLRIPVAQYDSEVDNFRRMGVVVSEQQNANDVTGQLLDVKARIRDLASEKRNLEVQLSELGKGRRAWAERIDLRETIREIQSQIDELSGNQSEINGQVRYSTLDLSLREKKNLGTGAWAADANAEAGGMLRGAGEAIGRGAIYLAYLSPIWIPLTLLARWWSKRTK